MSDCLSNETIVPELLSDDTRKRRPLSAHTCIRSVLIAPKVRRKAAKETINDFQVRSQIVPRGIRCLASTDYTSNLNLHLSTLYSSSVCHSIESLPLHSHHSLPSFLWIASLLNNGVYYRSLRVRTLHSIVCSKLLHGFDMFAIPSREPRASRSSSHGWPLGYSAR